MAVLAEGTSIINVARFLIKCLWEHSLTFIPMTHENLVLNTSVLTKVTLNGKIIC